MCLECKGGQASKSIRSVECKQTRENVYKPCGKHGQYFLSSFAIGEGEVHRRGPFDFTQFDLPIFFLFFSSQKLFSNDLPRNVNKSKIRSSMRNQFLDMVKIAP